MLALFAVSLTVGVAPAAAKTPCWKKVVQDWYADGRIDDAYSAGCLSESTKHIPKDLLVYSSFEDEARRARQQAARGLAVTKPRAGGPLQEEPGDGLFKQAFDKTSPRNADSMPLPLLILAGLALLLIAAGAGGLVSRRLRARRARAS